MASNTRTVKSSTGRSGGLTVTTDTDEASDWADEDLAPVADNTILDQLRAEITKKVERPPIRMEVPERPNMSLRFSPNIKQEQLNTWRKRAGEGTKKGMNTTHFSTLVISNTNIGIYLNDELVHDDNGNPVRLSSETILQMTATSRVADAIRSIYGVDPHIDATALKILEHAGYGDDVDEEENPTEG